MHEHSSRSNLGYQSPEFRLVSFCFWPKEFWADLLGWRNLSAPGSRRRGSSSGYVAEAATYVSERVCVCDVRHNYDKKTSSLGESGSKCEPRNAKSGRAFLRFETASESFS